MPAFQMTDGGIMPVDLRSGQSIGPVVQVAQAAPVAVATPAPVARVTKPLTASTQPAQLDPRQVIKLARQRYRAAKRELAKAQKLTRDLSKEVASLERLLAAADGKQLSVVRELRKSS